MYTLSKGQYDIYSLYQLYKNNSVKYSKSALMWFNKRFAQYIVHVLYVSMHNWVIKLSVRYTWKKLFLSTSVDIGNIIIVIISGSFRKTLLLEYWCTLSAPISHQHRHHQFHHYHCVPVILSPSYIIIYRKDTMAFWAKI